MVVKPGGRGTLSGGRSAAGCREAGRRSLRHAGDGALRPALGHRQRRLGLPGVVRAVPASALVRALGSACGRPGGGGRGRGGVGEPTGERQCRQVTAVSRVCLAFACLVLSPAGPPACRGRCCSSARLTAGEQARSRWAGDRDARAPGLEQPSPPRVRRRAPARGAAATPWTPESRGLGMCFLESEATPASFLHPARERPAPGTCQIKDGKLHRSVPVPFLSRLWLNSTRSRQA